MSKINLNLSKEESLIQLDLRKDLVDDVCKKHNVLDNLTSRVALVLDISGSMHELFYNGTVQAVIERILPLALKFDDNGELDLWLFNNSFYRLDGLTKDNYYGYVKNVLLKDYNIMGGTCYSPVMNDIKKKYIEEDFVKIPNYVIFITDGDNSDHRQTINTITDLSYKPIFWQYVGIGNTSFSFLEKLDDLEDRYVDNANFFQLNDINNVDDSTLYDRLLGEYPCWLNYPEVQDLIKNPKTPNHGNQNSTEKKKGFFGTFFDF